jgi:hypothetical protein
LVPEVSDITSACSLTPKPPHFCVTRCAQTLTQKHSCFGAAEAGVIHLKEIKQVLNENFFISGSYIYFIIMHICTNSQKVNLGRERIN